MQSQFRHTRFFAVLLIVFIVLLWIINNIVVMIVVRSKIFAYVGGNNLTADSSSK